MLATIRSTTPSFLTLAGELIQIGILNVSVATSIGSSVPLGIVLLDHRDESNSTTVKLVQSIKLSVDCISNAGLNNGIICSNN